MQRTLLCVSRASDWLRNRRAAPTAPCDWLNRVEGRASAARGRASSCTAGDVLQSRGDGEEGGGLLSWVALVAGGGGFGEPQPLSRSFLAGPSPGSAPFRHALAAAIEKRAHVACGPRTAASHGGSGWDPAPRRVLCASECRALTHPPPPAGTPGSSSGR